MGYQISYDRGYICKRTININKNKLKRYIFVSFLIALALVLTFPAGRIWVRDLLLPGNESVTAAALEDLVQSIRQGTPISDAMSGFCQQIIYGS